jgi:hypothetical protein
VDELDPFVASLVRKAILTTPTERVTLCQNLASLGEPGVQGLTVLLSNADANIRWEAVAALSETETPATVPTMKAMLRDSNWGVRSEAAKGLGDVGSAGDEAILRTLAASDPSNPVRLAAMRAIETLRNRLKTGVKRREPRTRPTEAATMTQVPATPMVSTEPVERRADDSASSMVAPVEPVTKPMTTQPAPEIGLVPVNELAAPATGETLNPTLKTATIPRPGVEMMSPATKPSDARTQPSRLASPADAIPFESRPTNDAVGKKPALPVDDNAVRAASKRVDNFVYAKIAELGLEVSPQATDAEFLRRITLDLTGKIPPANVAADFILVKNRTKRERRIDELLESAETNEHLARVWTAWLIGDATENQQEEARLREWVQTALAQNRRYDEIARQLIATAGPSNGDGAANYLLRYDVSPTEVAARTSRFFLGLPMQCAQCHDHKTESWTQKDFYGIVAFFAPTQREPVYEDVVQNGQKQQRYVGSYLRDKEVYPVPVPDRGITVTPQYPNGAPALILPGQNARKVYADWVTSPENPYFAKATVNRVWAYFFGRGIVDPVDGFGTTHAATHPELLDFLANDFVEHGYDLRYLVRVLLNTQAYQRSSKTTEKNKHDELYLTHAPIRPLTASQIFASLLEATNVESAEKRRQRDFDAMRSEYERQYRFLFGNDEQEAEIVNKATISQALMMLNGTIVNEGSRDVSGTRLDRILQSVTARDKRLDAVYLTTLSRLPTPSERSYFRFYYDGSSYRDKDKCFEDLYWSLLNSAEFASNH